MKPLPPEPEREARNIENLILETLEINNIPFKTGGLALFRILNSYLIRTCNYEDYCSILDAMKKDFHKIKETIPEMGDR